MGFTEASTIQAALLEWAEDAGWEHVPGRDLPGIAGPRDEHDVLVEPWVREALVRLNPDLATGPNAADNLDAVLHEVEQAILDAQNGLVAANETVTVMLRGGHAFKTVDGLDVPRRFFDFEDPGSNRLTVSEEVSITGGHTRRRFDVVYYINGIPLVVAETKTPVKHQVSWVNAAKDIYDTYEREYPQFFATNVFNVATEGLQFRMAPIRTEPDPESEFWAPWGSLADDPATMSGPARVERGARLLLRAEVILDILHDFAMFRHARDASEQDIKFLPRYPQYEAVLDIHSKVLRGRPGGLAWHHQGSGKTELMAFAASRLLRDPKVTDLFGTAPTIIVIADRKDLVRQTADMFETADMPRLEVPESKGALWRVLKKDQPCVVITTVHKFADAGHLNDRPNIIVLVDEAHRTQEGKFGKAWRKAVPSAKFFGATGTPVESGGKSTSALFGDSEDEGGVMSRYTPEQSILDGFTKPVVVEGRAVGFDLSKDDLDKAFDELAEAEDLDEDQKGYLSNRGSRIEAVLSNPERIDAVCADIVEHYLTYVAPLGQKAQVVAYNQDLVVKYAERIEAELKRHGDRSAVTNADGSPGATREVAVVMSVVDSKDTPIHLRKHILSDEQVETIKRRFKRVDDPLSFVVVTAKLMTGFNAPIEGVLYLDKPLRAANLFQTITRPNRPWKNPLTDQRKEFGRVVDYIGLAKAIGEALLGPETGKGGDDIDKVNVTDVASLVAKFAQEMTHMLARFDGVNMHDNSQKALAEALERIPSDTDQRADFIEGFVALQRIWEFLDPNPMLTGWQSQYLWLARIYEAIRPRDISFDFVWEKYGAKTLALVHSHMSDVHVRRVATRNVTLDGPGMQKVKEIAAALRIDPPPVDPKQPGDVFQDVLDSIEARLRRMNEDTTPEYASLAQRIEALRNSTIHNVEESLAFLERALGVAQDLVAAEKSTTEPVVDLRFGALTLIVEENTPPGLHKIVPDIVERIDAIAVQVVYSGWSESDAGDKKVRRELRKVLKDFSLAGDQALFDKTYAYVRENY
ncbi:type I restriction endonuclease subunit R [Propionibacteriaceae bacterium Y1923]